MSRDKFEAWWQEKGQYTCPGGSAYEKRFCRASWLAGREFMRDEAATIAEKHEEGPGGSEAIRNIEL